MQSQKLVRLLSALLALGLSAPSLFAWGSKGHTIINRVAVESLPADVPSFLKTPDAVAEITYLGPEPDRWRGRAEPELNAEQAPDHFMDMEFANRIGTLPRQRYQYIAALYAYAAAHPDQAAEMRPERVGFQPYITSEVWERLKSAMRDYRTLSAKHEDTKPVEAAILFYAGWLGHYVADGSQPLHVTIQYNGWVGPNPNGYTTAHTIHSQFETAFVDAAVNAPDVQPLMTPVKTIGDEWDDYLAYLRHTGTYVEKVYQLDKQQGFDGSGTPEAKQFTAERLAAGASMLRDLIYAAWVKSAEPVPEWKPEGVAPPNAVLAPHSNAGSGFTGGALPPGVSVPTVYKVGDGVTPPLLKSKKDPGYSDAARKADYEGVCIVGLIVAVDGTPHNVHIVRPLGMGLDEKALEAVRQYRFAPAMFHGHPVPVEINIDVNFRTGQRSSDTAAPESESQASATSDQVFRKPWPAGFVTPKLVYSPGPEISKQALKHKASGTVVVGMIVGKDGLPSNVHVISSDSKYLVDGALAAARQYRFEPGKYKGVPVVTEMEVGIAFNLF